jgi:hypothetical protein
MENTTETMELLKTAEISKTEIIESETGAPEKTEIKSYHPIAVRPMTRPQIKAFRATGLDYAVHPENADNQSKLVDMVDWIIDNIYGDLAEQTDKLEHYQLSDLAVDTCKRAYRGPESIKN